MSASPSFRLPSLDPALVARLEGALRTWPVRVAVALVCLGLHLVVMVQSGARFGVPFNAAPGQPPAFAHPATDATPAGWNRLVMSRWDTGHYLNLGLRGYTYCPPKSPTGALSNGPTCDLAFFPAYGLIGRWASLGGTLPIDVAMVVVSLLASFLFLFLWTGPALTERLGVWQTTLALVLFNVFTTGFTLVTAQTEPLTLLFTFGSFVAFRRERRLAAALLAGAATGMRLTGAATGAACGIALLVDFWGSDDRRLVDRLRQVGLLLLCGWGLLALMAYHGYRFGDPLAYIHAHDAAFRHESSAGSLLWPAADWLALSIEHPLHEGVWLVAALFWFLLGRREAMGAFPRRERAFWYGLFVVTLAIPVVGLISISFAGMNRYLLLALPLFFAMASAMRGKPVLIALWIALSAWHYWNIDVCEYTGGPGNHTLQVCHAQHWIGRI